MNTQEAIFSDWNGGIKTKLADISYERRTGYSWYGYWPDFLVKSLWVRWKKRVKD